MNPSPSLFRLSGAEILALAGALVLLLLHALPAAGSWLEYRYALLATQPWRALGAHLVHINWTHVGINAAAWYVVARLFAPDLSARQQALVLLLCALAISAGLALLHPSIVWYRGFSGVLHGLFFAGAACWLAGAVASQRTRTWRDLWLPAALVAGGCIKVMVEQPGGSHTPFADWLGAGTVPQAHLLGAVTGALVGAAIAWRRRAGGAQAAPAADL